MNNNLKTIPFVLLALIMITFGLNKFFGFIAVDPPTDPIAQQFMGAMFSSYLYIVVAIAEVIGGVLLLIPRLRFIGWLILCPIIFNIIAFHLFHDFIGNGIWLLPSILFIACMFFQWNQIERILNIQEQK